MARRGTSEAPAPWSSFRQRFPWRQGEHVTLIGPTGCGKTFLARAILDLRGYVVFVATKPRDPVVTELKARGFRMTRHWPPPITWHKVIFWPNIDRISDVPEQRKAIGLMLEDVYASGGWTVVVDELRYCVGRLGLAGHLEMLWQQGRSLNVSLVTCAQRPAHVPLAAYSQASHLFLWRTGDERDLVRLAEFGTADSTEVRYRLSTLGRHDVLYVNPITGELAQTRVEE